MYLTLPEVFGTFATPLLEAAGRAHFDKRRKLLPRERAPRATRYGTDIFVVIKDVMLLVDATSRGSKERQGSIKDDDDVVKKKEITRNIPIPSLPEVALPYSIVRNFYVLQISPAAT